MAQNLIGDMLFTFNGSSEGCPRRAETPWALAKSFGPLSVYQTQPDALWRGFPLTEFQDEAWQAWLLGEFYAAPPSLPRMFSDPGELNGHFMLLGYERSTRHLHVVTNRLGTVHVYHAAAGGKSALGTFSPAVAHAAGVSTLDLQAMAEFFTFGFFLGESTFWQGLRLLPAAAHTILDETGQVLSQARYWQWSYQPSPDVTYDDSIDQFHALFGEVLRGQVSHKRAALPLSGGLDSRSTLAELGSADRGGAVSLFPFSYGYSEDSVETGIARRLGSARGFPVKTWTVQPYLFDQLKRVCASVEGFQDVTLCRQAFVVDELAEQADFVVAGHWGDVWLDDMGFLGQEMLSDDRLADLIVSKNAKRGSEILQSLFTHNLPPTWLETMTGKVRARLAEYDEINELDFKVKAWKTSQWSWRWTLSSLRMFQAGLFPLLPFYDNRLVDAFMRIPGEFVAGRRLQVDYLKRYAPDLARVNWQQYGADLYHYKGFNSWLLPGRVVKKLARRLSSRPVVQRNWEVQFLNPQGREGLNRYLLTPGLKLHELFTVPGLNQLIKDFYQQPTASRGYAVSMLLTVSAWLEFYA